jgi:hypothetical protein
MEVDEIWWIIYFRAKTPRRKGEATKPFKHFTPFNQLIKRFSRKDAKNRQGAKEKQSNLSNVSNPSNQLIKITLYSIDQN